MNALIDRDAFRRALGHYASGITVIAAHDGREPVGFTCQSFYSVSLDPPLVSFSVKRDSNSWPRIRPLGHFAISILSAGQRHVSNALARSGDDKWSGVSWSMARERAPTIHGCLLWLHCDLYAEHEAGDHTIVLGHVQAMSEACADGDADPLLYFRGAYHRLTEAT